MFTESIEAATDGRLGLTQFFSNEADLPLAHKCLKNREVPKIQIRYIHFLNTTYTQYLLELHSTPVRGFRLTDACGHLNTCLVMNSLAPV